MSQLMPETKTSRTIPIARPVVGSTEEEAVIRVLRSGWLSQGPRVAEFEASFARYVGARHAIAVSSCTTALQLSLVALNLQPGEEVICPSLSFIATANCIVHAGGTPVFADIDRHTYNIDPDSIEDRITPSTRAILLVHQIGLPANLDAILAIAARHGLEVIEDAACAIGSEYFGVRIGAPHARIACFSFHPRKILTTGEGGMITTDDDDLGARLRRLRQHSMSVSDIIRHNSSKVMIENYDEVGYNFRMTDLQAAIGLAQLDRLDDMIFSRRRLAARYSEALTVVDWLRCPIEPKGYRHNYQSYMVRLTPDAPVGRDFLMQKLLEAGISTRRGIMAIHRELPFRGLQSARLLRETESAADEAMILPLFDGMTDDDQEYIVEHVRNCARL
jgi:perosamine synthetase